MTETTEPTPCPICGKVHYLGGSTRRCSFPQGHVVVPIEPTRAMLDAARDWSIAKYGHGIGNDAAQGCWKAMMEAARAG